MTRKLIAATLGLMVGMVLLASPAQAIHYGKNTVLHEWGNTTVAVSIMVNKSDVNCCNFEGLSDNYEWTNPDVNADPDIRYDWVRLYKNGNQVLGTGSTGWMNIGSAWSTAWYDVTCTGPNVTLLVKARYQIRFNNGAGHISAWFTNSSDNVTACN